MNDILIKNSRIINPAGGVFEVLDLLVKGGKIAALGRGIEAGGAAKIIDGEGLWAAPGLIDLHVHFREPGFEYKETIATGAAAAARGGFTTVCCMANTSPAIDSPELVKHVMSKAADVPVNILQFGAATKGMLGEELSDMEGMARAGAAGISDDGKTVFNSALYLEAVKMAQSLGLTMYSHCEDSFLGTSPLGEELIIARDIMLAETLGAKLHICHISTAKGLKLVTEARTRGGKITCEAAPHHLILSEEDIPEGNTNYKMSPPLRSKEDVLALREGLKKGYIDCIATDHAPHSPEDKSGGFAAAANGVIGLETAFPMCYTELVKTGLITVMDLICLMSFNPAKILGKDKGTLSVGADGDIFLFDPESAFRIDAAQFASKGRNTPWHGQTVMGKVRMTICGGEIVYDSL